MFYFTLFHGFGGQTPGKKLLGLRVVQSSGKPMTPGLAFLRWVGYIISQIPLCLGFIWIAFDGRKQGWHDKIAATCVIKTRVTVPVNSLNRLEALLGDASQPQATETPSVAGYGEEKDENVQPQNKWYPY